jgi:serine/threonine protein kinase
VSDPELRARLERLIEHHVTHGTLPPVAAVCADRPDLAGPLASLVERYQATLLELSLEPSSAEPPEAPLPAIDGFRTIERVGRGGMGEVYKLQDLKLGRLVAAKVLRPGARFGPGAAFLDEARAMALFSDPRIVQVFEYRADRSPPVIIMEFVDGFELGRLAPSLEYHQRARIMKDVAETVHHAHRLGLFHRDLKPSNVMLDAALVPRILDFGLSTADASSGHFMGTPAYLAPEQLDPAQPIDARADVYAMGVMLYELLAGALPYGAQTTAQLVEEIRAGDVRLPAEIDPAVPEPLQAIALKAMERRPEDRYASARDLALDLQRYLDGRPVLARPSLYATTLETRVRPHQQQVNEWERLRLIYPHEAARLRSTYWQLQAREDDWIVEGRTLSYSQIALYLGAFFVMCGSLFYFGAHRFYDAVRGLARPAAVLALPFLGLNLAARSLYRREHKAVAVAFYLGGVSLLPLFLLILFHESGLWVVAKDTPGQIFSDGSVSNRQLQITVLVACTWAGWLALHTRTGALSTVFAVLAFLLALTVLGDFGLRRWFEDGRYDLFAAHLMPVVALYAIQGQGLERWRRAWFARPQFVGAAVVTVLAFELLALDGRMFQHLGLSLKPFQDAKVSDPELLDTLAALSLNGLGFYAIATGLDRFGSEVKSGAAWLLFSICPFAVLEPLAWLVRVGEYHRAFDWLYLALSVGTALASHARQRRSFYYAGVLNSGVALWFIADHRKWFDKPAWAIALIAVGLGALVLGFALSTKERRARPVRRP